MGVDSLCGAGIDDGEDVDSELLSGIYERVRACQFQPSADHVLQVVKVEQMILGKKPVCHPTLVHYSLLVHPPRGVRSTVMSMSVCLSVSLSVRSHNLKTTQLTFTKFLCILLMTLIHFSSGGIAIPYVLPVL